MPPVSEIPILGLLVPEGTSGLTALQWMAVVVGALLIATRLPGLLAPRMYRKIALRLARGRPGVMRAAGGFLWVVALMILLVIVQTLPPLQSVMLIFAVLFAVGGGLILFFPAHYQRVAEKVLVVIPGFALRLVSLGVVALGFTILLLSLSAP